ncbi:MAG: CopD family protein [Chitinophagia bacterium]|nr:CopD family protein [Chitinophagia bacterium]
MEYLFFKSLHIISMVAWFAGLFYLVRLFVYHREAFDLPEVEKRVLTQQYHIMESRLHRIICQPAMIITWLFGLLMIYSNGLEWLASNPWLHVKLVLVIILTVYHLRNPYIISALQEEKSTMSSFQFRLYNEIPTIVLLGSVILAVYKNLSNFAYTFGGMLLFSIVLFLFARWYKKLRTKD